MILVYKEERMSKHKLEDEKITPALFKGIENKEKQ
jgi:hypothetical protein